MMNDDVVEACFRPSSIVPVQAGPPVLKVRTYRSRTKKITSEVSA